MCKYNVVESQFMYQLLVLQRFQIAQVTSKLAQVIGTLIPFHRPYMISYLFSILTSPFLRYYHLFSKIKRLHVTAATPTQGTVCNLSAKTSYSKPVYKISSF